MNHFTRDQRDHIGFRESDSYNRLSDDLRSDSTVENYFGKGPKGYKRSQERIKEEACEILTEDFALDASDIEVDVKGDEIILRGEVSTRKDKKRAEYLVEDISGVHDVQNLLTVRKSSLQGWIPGLGPINETKGGQDGEA